MGDVAEVFVKGGQSFGSRLAHFGNGQGKEPTIEPQAARAFERLDEFRGVFFAERSWLVIGAKVERAELLNGKIKQIDRFFHQTAFNEFIGNNVAEAFDIECGSGAEMIEPLRRLRRALRIDATPRDKLFVLANLFSTCRALVAGRCAHVERFGVCGTLFDVDCHDRGNNVAGFFDADGVADSDIFASDFLFVVEGSPADGGAADEDGFQLGNGGEDAGTADLDGDGFQRGFGLLGGVFVGHGPTWGFVRGADFFPESDGVEFDDGAVGFIREGFGDGLQFADTGQQLIGGPAAPDFFGSFEACLSQVLQCFDLRLRQVAVFLIQGGNGVDDGIQRAFCDQFRIQLLQGTGRRIARIDESGFAGRLAFGIEFGETFFGHEDFAADFENFWNGIQV